MFGCLKKKERKPKTTFVLGVVQYLIYKSLILLLFSLYYYLFTKCTTFVQHAPEILMDTTVQILPTHGQVPAHLIILTYAVYNARLTL